MIRKLNIKGYRLFKDFTIDGMKNVNLIVGENNSGKTALLEALYLASTEWGSEPFLSILMTRNEFETRPDDEGKNRKFLELENIFYRSDITDDKFISLGIDDEEELFVKPTKGDHNEDPVFSDKKSLTVTSNHPGDNRKIYEELMFTSNWRYRKKNASRFMNVRTIYEDSLSIPWNKLIESNQEKEVVEIMRLILPDLENIFFLDSGNSENDRIMFDFRDFKKRRDVREYGEGVRRLLSIAIRLVSSSEGDFLLIDEIETGFHYSLFPALWRDLIKLSNKFGIQLFVTTHSLDFLNGLKVCISENSSFANEIAVHKLHRDMDFAITLTDDKLLDILTHELEVR